MAIGSFLQDLGVGPLPGKEEHDTTHGIMGRLWLAHSNLYCMYGMWYFGELTKLCAYDLLFMVFDTFGTKGKGSE